MSSESGNINDKNESGIVEYLKILVKFKKIILISTGIVFLIMVFMMFFVVKPQFLSSATVKSSEKALGIGSLLGSAGLPDLGGLEELGGGSASKELALYEEILASRKCAEATVIKFNLMGQNNIRFMEDAVKFYREEVLDLAVNKKANTMSIGAYSINPQEAQDIVNFLVIQLNDIYSEISVKNAKINREFIEQRYNSVKADLQNSEDSLRIFQDKYGVAPDLQIQAAAKTEIEIEAEIKSEEVKLELLEKILSPDQAEIATQKERINALRKQLAEIQNSMYGENKLNLKGAPEVALNFLRLKRNLEIQNKILATLIPIYEQAKIEEKRETPTVIVIDDANLPEKKKKPKRIVTILIATVATFTIVSMMTIIYEKYYKSLYGKIKKDA